VIEAVVFDLDGVLLDSEQAWDDARRALADEAGIAWPDGATRAMMGMSSKEWPVYVRDEVGVPLDAEEINGRVVGFVLERYVERLPLLPGARDAVARMAGLYPLGLASSSNREVIDIVLAEMGVQHLFEATVSSEEVARGKPSHDVYAEALRRVGVERAAAVEDSGNGIRSAHAAGLRTIAIPNPHFPPEPEALALADAVLAGLDALTGDVVEGRE